MTVVADTHLVWGRLRGLWPALAVSLLLHLLLFWPTESPPGKEMPRK
jgi:hypothetical protein